MLFERKFDTYRRGLTLGLTMAEIFILVVFLLLLLLLGLSAINSQNKAKIAQIQSNLTKVETERDRARNRTPKKIENLEREKEALESDLAIAKEDATKYKDSLKQEKNKSAELQKENERLRDHITDITIDKGIDPPCWYFVTEDDGKREEDPYYLLDVAVHDDYLSVLLRDPPPGSAVDETGKIASTTYLEEYMNLPLAPFRSAGDMSTTTFARVADPILRLGKNKKIRDYACVFYVKVWDMTGQTKKLRWKRALRAIKGPFYVYEVQDELWRGD